MKTFDPIAYKKMMFWADLKPKKREQLDAIPLPLDRYEMDGFVQCGLSEQSFLAYDDTQVPSVPHFFGVYKK